MSKNATLAPPTVRESERWAAYMDALALGYASRGRNREASDCRHWAKVHRRSAAVQRAKDEPDGQGVLDFGGAA